MKRHIIHFNPAYVLLLVTIFLLLGCAINYRAGKVPDMLLWPPEGTINRKSVSVRVDVNTEFYGHQVDIKIHKDVVHSHIVAMFNDARLFSNVVDDRRSPQSTDLRVYVLVSEKHYIPWYSYFTLWTKHRNVTIELDVRDHQGQRLGIVTKSEKETELRSILFIPIALFTARPSLMDLYDDVLRAAITEAHAKGLL